VGVGCLLLQLQCVEFVQCKQLRDALVDGGVEVNRMRQLACPNVVQNGRHSGLVLAEVKFYLIDVIGQIHIEIQVFNCFNLSFT